MEMNEPKKKNSSVPTERRTKEEKRERIRKVEERGKKGVKRGPCEAPFHKMFLLFLFFF